MARSMRTCALADPVRERRKYFCYEHRKILCNLGCRRPAPVRDQHGGHDEGHAGHGPRVGSASSSARGSLLNAQSKRRRSEACAWAGKARSNDRARSCHISHVLVAVEASPACRRDYSSTTRQTQWWAKMNGLKGWVRCYVHVVRGNFRRRLLRTGRVEVTTSVFWTTAAEALNPSDPRLRSFEQ